jgi:hypothetical protein
MTLHGLYAALAQVVPDLNGLVVACRDKIRFVRAGVEFDVVDTLFMCLHGEIRATGAKRPHLNGAIETCRCEGVGIFGAECEIHDIVGVTFVNLG